MILLINSTKQGNQNPKTQGACLVRKKNRTIKEHDSRRKMMNDAVFTFLMIIIDRKASIRNRFPQVRIAGE